MLTLLAGMIKGAKATEGSPTATSSVVTTPSETITSAIVSVLDASGKSASVLASSAKSPTTVSTDKESKKDKKDQEKPKSTTGGKEKGELKRNSDRPGRKFTTVGPKKRQHVDSVSSHEQPKKQPKGQLGLVATLRKSEGEWQGRAAAPENELCLLKAQYKKLEKEYGELRTSSESDRVRLAAAEATERARAYSWKTRAAGLKAELEVMKAERDTNARLLDEVEASAASLEEQVAEAESAATQSREALDKFKANIDSDLEELQRLRRETTLVVPSGRLTLHHRSSKSEALWSPVGKVEAYGSLPDEDQTKLAWSAVAETLKTQQRDFATTWEGAERAVEK
jgi:chromosome segregation ATPase